MPEMSERVLLVQAIFAGLKDLGLVAASVATIWIQSGNAAKLDKVETAQADIARTAEKGTDTITAWRAQYERPAAKVEGP
jgi:hypothetical protein